MVRFFFTCFLRTLRGNVKAQKRECTQRAIERTAADAQAKVLCFGQLDSNMGVLWRCPTTVQAHNACVRVVRPSRETLCMWRKGPQDGDFMPPGGTGVQVAGHM